MKSTTSRIAAYACLAVLASACGKKDKDNDKESAPAKIEQPSVVGTEAQGGQTRISFSSATKDAKFKCLIQAEGQPASDAWVDCAADGWVVETQPGVRYNVKIKALSADGKRESDVREFNFTAAGDDSTQQLELAAVILNKADVPASYTRTSLKLNLGVDGAAIDSEEVRFECKREYDQDFGRCGDNATYDFGVLIDGSTYTIAVRAVHDASKTTSTEDTLSFTVQLAQLSIDGADALAADQTSRDKINLTFDPAQVQGLTVSCLLDGVAIDCSNGLLIDLPAMKRDAPGSHKLKIEAKDASLAVVATRTINFCAGRCETDGGSSTGAPMVQAFQIGSFYQYLVEPGMHVTEYATTKTYNNQLAFYRISTESDPFYLGNYGCYRDWDSKISAASPAGDINDYCLTTPPNRDLYKWLTDYRLANNHLEIATDKELVGQYEHERISMNVFDSDYEFMQDRSRFEQLCMNRRGTIQKTPPIRFLDRGFWGESVKAEFYMCVATLTGPSFGGLPQANDKWWVGAFFITSDSLNLPLFECFKYDYRKEENAHYYGNKGPEFCGKYKNPSLLEVTYMTKTPWMTPEDFARDAQTKFTKNLQELTPILH